ncbi:hypothetical protein chiPu_0028070, partial [Chiloscyllium punctatum]|nr:hypothetical protein [Chiloscyllium punctatum]
PFLSHPPSTPTSPGLAHGCPCCPHRPLLEGGKTLVKLTVGELRIFIEQLQGLPCVVTQIQEVQELLEEVEKFQTQTQAALKDLPANSQEFRQLIEQGQQYGVELPEIAKLQHEARQAEWLDQVRETLAASGRVTLELIRPLIEAGSKLASNPAVEKAMAELQELLTISERWEEKAQICLEARYQAEGGREGQVRG